jgi:hypothetical protein
VITVCKGAKMVSAHPIKMSIPVVEVKVGKDAVVNTEIVLYL